MKLRYRSFVLYVVLFFTKCNAVLKKNNVDLKSKNSAFEQSNANLKSRNLALNKIMQNSNQET
ncbi:hypothetical protein C2G38_2062107 [Gigaspora rosea]|uniref:Uncharacterized protein n=1 Tax=Gigaspora rosea TaxID=44941 RepID=A0A397W7R2_9GLOM|nr:hypothetical protein C2G38_2062107 [Gigaspora rosea]